MRNHVRNRLVFAKTSEKLKSSTRPRFCIEIGDANLPEVKKQVIGQGKVLSKATIFGDLIFISGIGPHDPKTGKQVEGGIREQTKAVMDLLKAAVEEAGSCMDNILKCTVFLTDMNYYSIVNEIYSSYFKVPPARTCVQVSKLPRPEENCMIEIDAIACKA
ncbi:reactive intermediate/imine deaminase [Candidatus Bathyarchaeota archaeon]|nr:reactive intermediate/imine deaminase [Candidatus Bathyarchaeota archaeon]